jgi:NADPH2:quinone reductase
VEAAPPGAGEIHIRQVACGLNYIDTYHRSGLYPLPLPATIGMEAAGVVDALGNGVDDFQVGDRVCYGAGPPGAYTELRNIDASRVIALPDDIDEKQAAGMMLKGMTAQYLIRRTYPVQPGDPVLFHAAAGGVGLIACQWLKHLGATVIGTVGSDAKAELARAHGCDHPIVYRRENFAERVREITEGRGVPVVYDSVGKDTFEPSLDCLQPRGLLVSFGNASGAVPRFEPGLLAQKGSLYLTRPTLMTYVAERDEHLATAHELFDVVRRGIVRVNIAQTYALRDAAQAHSDLEARKTTGSTVLLP